MHNRRYLLAGLLAVLVALIVWALASGSEEAVDPKDAARERAMRAQIESGLKNAATAAETYAVDNDGSYAHADESDLIALGLQLPADVTLAGLEMEEARYCIILEHQLLPRDHAWRLASYSSDEGTTSSADDCP